MGIVRNCNSFCRSATAFAVALAALSSARAGAEGPPAEAFAALPAMDSPSLSADGKRLAFITHADAESYILVSNLEDMSVTAAIEVQDGKPRSVYWANDEALVFTAGLAESLTVIPGQLESTSPYGVDLSGEASVTRLLRDRGSVTRRGGGGARRIGGFLGVGSAQLIGREPGTGRVLYPKFNVDGDRVLYAVDAKNDHKEIIDKGSRFTRDWVVDESGEPRFRIDYTQRGNRFTLLARGEHGWDTLISETVDIPELRMFGLNADGELVVGTRSKETGTFGLYLLSKETGDLGERVLADSHFDVGGVRIDPYTNRVVGAFYSGSAPVWFDDVLARQQKLLTGAFPGESPEIVSWSEDRNRFVVVTQSAARAPAVYLYDADAESVTQIASVFPALQGVELPERREYEYTARDGTTIPAYLTRPIGANGPTPTVVLPHGGPAARDMAGFDWLAQFLGSRGYTVLQPNFRGSGGYGTAWQEAGYGQWGLGVMQDDLTDGVAALIEQELADPDRVCIVGASYGGYAALAGAVFTPDLYRCAAAIAGVSDLAGMMDYERDRRGGFSPAVSSLRRALGGTEAESDFKDHLEAASPAAHAEQARAPILLVHGREDAVVPLDQSRRMEDALRKAGKPVELVELDGEDHWLSGAATRLATLQALERFLAENLGG